MRKPRRRDEGCFEYSVIDTQGYIRSMLQILKQRSRAITLLATEIQTMIDQIEVVQYSTDIYLHLCKYGHNGRRWESSGGIPKPEQRSSCFSTSSFSRSPPILLDGIATLLCLVLFSTPSLPSTSFTSPRSRVEPVSCGEDPIDFRRFYLASIPPIRSSAAQRHELIVADYGEGTRGA